MLLLEGEIDCCQNQAERHQIIPAEGLGLKQEQSQQCEDYQRDALLNNLQLKQREWASIAQKTDAVGGDGQAVLKEGYAPREGDDGNQGPALANARFAQLEVAVPSYCHEDV